MAFEDPETNNLAQQLQGMALNVHREQPQNQISLKKQYSWNTLRKKKKKQTKKQSKEKDVPPKPDGSIGQAEVSRTALQPKLGTVIRQRLSDWEQEIKRVDEFKDPKITEKFNYLREGLN
ncbi:hypothetical protein F8M41_007832 [Gigaspora margarita]|uniref:Uncharacterized protein n=1 Tax=Gigaspora margarita TaxID=4874 RepID=A0A8H4AW06_GIGMA|nr:hypothetical protein F8M41_007832 [Gigaspora margarita]